MDGIVSWLTLAEQMFLIKVETIDGDDDEMRQFIRCMIVSPLLRVPDA
jgi:hypothetical protein